VFHCVLLFECENISSQYPNCTKTEASSVAGTRISNVMSFDQSQLSTWLTWRSRHDTLYDVEYRAGVVNLLLFTSEFEILTFLTNSAFLLKKAAQDRFLLDFFSRKGFTLIKHCLNCIFITNLFWREPVVMKGVKLHSPVRTSVTNSSPKLTHFYPKVKTGEVMKVVCRHWIKYAERCWWNALSKSSRKHKNIWRFECSAP